MPEKALAWIGLGANIGDPVCNLRKAAIAIAGLDDLEILACSSLYQTVPLGDTNQPDFINAVMRVKTALTPIRLLEQLLSIESALGRVRNQRRWGPRLIDLDLLMVTDLQISEPRLKLPHPRMHQRKFVLVPLLEISPGINIPGVGPANKALELLQDSEPVMSGEKWCEVPARCD